MITQSCKRGVTLPKATQLAEKPRKWRAELGFRVPEECCRQLRSQDLLEIKKDSIPSDRVWCLESAHCPASTDGKDPRIQESTPLPQIGRATAWWWPVWPSSFCLSPLLSWPFP